MRKIRPAIALLLLLLFTPTVRAHWEEHDLYGRYMFGYAGVAGNLTFFLPEIEANGIPTNVMPVEVHTAADNLQSQISYLRSHGQKAIVVLDRLLFLNDPALNTDCGSFAWRQRFDYRAKFDAWLNVNRSSITLDKVAILVINTEVNNRCIESSALDAVTQYVVSKVPSIPTVAGYGRSGNTPRPFGDIPKSLAGVLFFKYQIFDPRTDAAYQADFKALKAKLNQQRQRIVLVPDGFYASGHKNAGWQQWYLGYLALNYMHLTLNDPMVVGMMIFLWPTLVQYEDTLRGTRDLPQSVRDRHRDVGLGLNIQPG